LFQALRFGVTAGSWTLGMICSPSNPPAQTSTMTASPLACHQHFRGDALVNCAGHHMFQHAGAAQLMNITCKEIQDDKDPKDRQENAEIGFFGTSF
jgi:hypothetical protein